MPAAGPDALPTCRHVSFSGPSTDLAADGGGGKQRDLQLQALRDQLSALELGINPNGAPQAAASTSAAAVAAAGVEAPSAASPGPRGRSRNDVVVGGAGSQPGSQPTSPHRRWWQRGGRAEAAPAAGAGRPLRLQTSRSLPQEDDQPSSPALLYAQRAEQWKQDAVQASQQIDAALQRSSSGSPNRLARLFGRGGSPAAAKQTVAAAAVGAGHEATYDLQVQSKAGGASAAAAANPLRSSNSASDGGGATCAAAGAGSGSSRGSPRGSRDFRISSFSPENRSGAGSPVQQSGLGPAGGGSGGCGRPRSGQGQASRPHMGQSPRKQAWKPL